MADWSNFFFAQTGASAALTGLIFVAVSINLNRILSMPRLPNRALGALVVLLSILILSSLMLVPGQSITTVGTEVLAGGIVLWLMVTILDLRIRQATALPHRRAFTFNMLLTQIAVLPYIVAGISILTRATEGLYWLVPAFILSFIKAILDAWVLLVEINR